MSDTLSLILAGLLLLVVFLAATRPGPHLSIARNH